MHAIRCVGCERKQRKNGRPAVGFRNRLNGACTKEQKVAYARNNLASNDKQLDRLDRSQTIFAQPEAELQSTMVVVADATRRPACSTSDQMGHLDNCAPDVVGSFIGNFYYSH